MASMNPDWYIKFCLTWIALEVTLANVIFCLHLLLV